jgi:NAD(P)-dependent dehydrogenase (short-subunit alcohol dehydrogenase family)
MENRESVVVVTGASSGIGNACATFLAKKGHRVYGTCRNPASYARKADEFFELLPMELSDTASTVKAAERIYAAEGKVDALICCAGSGLVGSIEDSSIEEAQSVMDINYFGTLRTIKAFLPRMREAGKGRILIIGGLEGLVATPYQGLYSASEFALEGLAQSLRIEIAGFGIQAGFIALGSFRTAFGQNRKLAASASETSPYKPMLESVLGILSRDEAGGADPLLAARAIYADLEGKRMAPRRTAGPVERRFLANLRHWLPAGVFEGRLRQYYRLG